MALREVIENFDNYGEFLNTIRTRGVNSVFQGRERASETGSSSFTGSNSFSFADDLAVNGYPEGLENMQRLKKSELKSYSGNSSKVQPSLETHGFAPHVPNAILGLPKSMISRKQKPIKDKVISILYHVGAVCSMSQCDLAKAGKNVLDICRNLELEGYRVAIHAMWRTYEREVATTTIKIKDWRQQPNWLKLAYPMSHPSFLRRHCFRWLESMPELQDARFPSGYGQSAGTKFSPDELREELTRAGFLDKKTFFTCVEEARVYDDISELTKKMGIKI